MNKYTRHEENAHSGQIMHIYSPGNNPGSVEGSRQGNQAQKAAETQTRKPGPKPASDKARSRTKEAANAGRSEANAQKPRHAKKRPQAEQIPANDIKRRREPHRAPHGKADRKRTKKTEEPPKTRKKPAFLKNHIDS